MKYIVFYDASDDKYAMFVHLGGIFDTPEEAQKLVDQLNKKHYYQVFQLEVPENKVIDEEIMHYIE